MSDLVYRREDATDSSRTRDLMSGAELVVTPLLPHDEGRRALDPQSGKIGWAILWLLGVPLPILLIAYLIWGR